MKHTVQKYIALLVIVVLGLFHTRYLNEFPSHIHAWAQADHYALALGFVNNHLNFFKPEVFVMNHQFPGNQDVATGTGITSVDFPIHDYIPALFMKLTGSTSPWIFRTYILLYSFIGLFFLFKLAYAITDDFFKSLLVLLFAATSPVFVYYQSGFLPTIPSLANAIIAFYFYFRWLQQKRKADFYKTILFLALATLSRTTFAIPLIAVFCVEAIRISRGVDKLKQVIAPSVIAVAAIGAYRMYNNFLAAEYGSMFLNHLLPAGSLTEAKEIIRQAYDNWGMQYFSKLHYCVYAFVAALALLFALGKRLAPVNERRPLSLLVLTMFIGYVAFALMMLRQFPMHDYYFLDTFYLPLVLLLILLLSMIPKLEFRYSAIVGWAMLIAFGVPSVVNALNTQKERREVASWDRTSETIVNFTNSGAFLDSLKIKPDAKMLVIDAYAPNIPFILMNRKGYYVLTTSRANIIKALGWNFDYLVVQNEFFVSDIYTNYPEIVTKVKKIADNDKISVCVKSDEVKNQSLQDFLEMASRPPVFQAIMTYDSLPVKDKHWENTESTTHVFHSGTAAGVLNSDKEYGITYKSKSIPPLTEKGRVLVFSGYFQKDSLKDCQVVVSINEKGKNVFYQSENLKDLLKKSNMWERVSLRFQLPQVKGNDYEFAIYLWNTGKDNLYVDDFSFKIY